MSADLSVSPLSASPPPETSWAAAEAMAIAAKNAFAAFCNSKGKARAEFLRSLASGIEALGEMLLEVAHAETALPLARLGNERGRTCMQLRMFADIAESEAWRQGVVLAADPQRQPTPRARLELRQRAVGPVLVFGASNFPLAFSVAGGDSAAALAVGCPVIAKAHPAHPRTCALVEQVIAQSLSKHGLDAGVFQVFYEQGIETGARMLAHPAICAGAFTGSQSGGLALLRIAQSRKQPIPFFAEMGSSNPLIVLPQALRDRGAALLEGLHQSLMMGVGQFCTRPGLILGIGADFTNFGEQLAQKFNVSPAGTMLSVEIAKRYGVALQAREACPGIKVLARGEPTNSARQAQAVLHSVAAADFLAQNELQHEVFGPTGLLVCCEDKATLQRCIEQLDGQLTASIWCSELERRELAELLFELENRAGRLVFNGFPTGVEVGPATMHGGPFPASSDSRFSSVGATATTRFVRPICYQE